MSASACESASEVGLQALEDRDRLALADLHDGLLPGARAPGGEPAALRLGRHRRRADLDDADVEELLDRLLDLRLVGIRMDAERVLARRRQHVRLLRDDGADDDLAGVHGLRLLPASDWLARERGHGLERVAAEDDAGGADEV